MKRVAGYVRSKQTGNGIPGINVTAVDDLTGNPITAGGVYKAAANPVATDSNGLFVWTSELSPGPLRMVADIPEGAEIKVRSGQETMQVGDFFLSDMPDMLKYWTFGVIKEDIVVDPLLVQPVTGQRRVRVLPGMANMRGYVYRLDTDRIIDIDQNTTLANRIDLVVLEQHVGGPAKGRQMISIVKGSLNGVVPSTNADANVFQFPIGQVSIPLNATSVTVTDTRIFSSPTFSIIGPNSINSTHIQDGTVALVDLAPNSVDSSKIVDGSVSSADLASGAVTTAKIGDQQVTHQKIGLHAVGDYQLADDQIAEHKLNPALRTKINSAGTTSTKVPKFADSNFPWSGNAISNRKLGSTVSITLAPGSWLIETQAHFTLRGSNWFGNGYGHTNVWLAGSGTPQGADASSRIFRTVAGVPRQVILTGRRVVTITDNTTYTAEAWVAHHDLDYGDVHDGVVMIKAT
jgi:hypothetical protein